jgi:hypothetical protein
MMCLLGEWAPRWVLEKIAARIMANQEENSMVNTSGRGFGAMTTADEILKDIDLTGRIAVVTGASGGIGKETARALAARRATVILSTRDN